MLMTPSGRPAGILNVESGQILGLPPPATRKK
jgi:hypothetical protein